ncbi:MAG TPA: OmpA family protein [Flavobacteriales bacterium]|nr:OmpA family protein [Flavobacteriales bacterium]
MNYRALLSTGIFISAFFAGISQVVGNNFNTTVTIEYKVKPVNKINSENAEFSPVILDNNLVFVSDREVYLTQVGESQWKKKKHLNIFKASFKSPSDDSVSFSKVQPFDDKMPDYFHSGPIAFHPTGNFAVLTRVITQRKTNKPQLYLVKKTGGKWSKPERLSFCGNDFSYGHACFNDAGDKIYFASDQLGTLGSKDIFVSDFKNETFTAPLNMGDKVNTASDEMFPFVQNNVLYFSSAKAGGLGGLDLYRFDLKNENQPAESLGNSINSPSDDFSFFLTKTGRNGFFASNRAGMGGDDIFFFTVKESATVVSKNILGKFTYAKLSEGFPSGLDVQLLDEAGNIVATTKTDANGGFQFTNLPADQEFTIKTVQVGEDLILHVYNKDGVEYAVLMSNSKGSFVYKKLDNDIGTLAFMELDEADINGKKTGSINGQFVHERLTDASVEGLNVILVDEAGNVYTRTITDKNGNFRFTKLPSDQNLFITTDSQYDDLRVLLFNSKDEVIADLKRSGAGPFIYRRLDGKLESSLSLLENKDLSFFPANYTNLEGRFKPEKLGGTVAGLDFMVLDEAGNVIGKGTTDSKGNFVLVGLPPKEVYIFKFDGDDAGMNTRDYKLEMLNRYDARLALLDAQDGKFTFDRRAKNNVAGNTNNNTNINTTVNESLVIYFEKDKWDIRPEDQVGLKKMLDMMRKDKNLVLEIDGHADAGYTHEHNMELSKMRMRNTKNYFASRGIDASRIKGAYFGETRLVNTCTDADKCSYEENGKNRRCELRLKSKQPK